MFFHSQEELERAQMEQQALSHEVRRLPHTLNKEQLKSFTVLMHTISNQENGSMVAAMYAGISESVAHFRFGQCMCGEEHEQAEDLLREAAKEEKPTESKSSAKLLSWHDENGMVIDAHPFQSFSGMSCTAMVTRIDDDGEPYGDECGQPPTRHYMSKSTIPGEPDEPILQSTERENLLKKYNVAFTDEGPSVVCNGCGMSYVSLRDRMLKGPDECHGCFLKAKEG